jgi:hypothetical protein
MGCFPIRDMMFGYSPAQRRHAKTGKSRLAAQVTITVEWNEGGANRRASRANRRASSQDSKI